MPSKSRFALVLCSASLLTGGAIHASPLGAVNTARLAPGAHSNPSTAFSCARAPRGAFVAFLSGAPPYNPSAEFGGAFFWARAGSSQWSLCGGQSGPVDLGSASSPSGYVQAYNDAAAVWDPSCVRPRTICVLAPDGDTVPVVRFVTGKPGRVIAALRARGRMPLAVTVSSNTARVATYAGPTFIYRVGATRHSGRLCSVLCHGFARGYGIATAPDGSVYLTMEGDESSQFSAVVRFLPSGKPQRLAMGSYLGMVGGIAIDARGDVLLADPYGGTVDIFTSDTYMPSSTIPTGGTPVSIALDAAQTHLYVTDQYDGWAAVYTYPAGALVLKATITVNDTSWSPASVFAL